jgi:hypothetical protein
MIDYQNTIKIKYSFLKTIKMVCKWIKTCPGIFIFSIFAGTILSIITGILFSQKFIFIYSFCKFILDSIIIIAIIIYSLIKYLNTNYCLKIKSYMKLFLVAIFFSIYSFTLVLAMEQINNIFLTMIFQYSGLYILILCIIDIIKNNSVVGIKYAFNIFIYNKLFFVKTVLFIIVLQIFFTIILGVLLSTISSVIKTNVVLPLLFITIRIIYTYIIIVFISEKEKEKNIYNENLYVA